MSVISVDMYLMFSSFEGTKRASERSSVRDMIPYHVTAGGIPMMIVVTSILVDNTPPGNHSLKPHYGERRCWLTNYSVLLFFGLPVMVTIIFDTVLYILAAIYFGKVF